MPTDPLTEILFALQDARQRATYGAVAGALGAVPYFLMSGRPRDPLHSWVVSKASGRPTHYPDDAVHPDLLVRDRVIDTASDLEAWLEARSP